MGNEKDEVEENMVNARSQDFMDTSLQKMNLFLGIINTIRYLNRICSYHVCALF